MRLQGNRARSGPVSRVLSRATISLGRRLLVGSSNLPGRVTRRTASRRRAVSSTADFALLGLASGGVCRAEPVTRPAGALLPHRFTLTSSRSLARPRRSAVCFLWHCPGSCERWALPTTVSCEARTFLRKLEQVQTCRDRPAHSAQRKLYGPRPANESDFAPESQERSFYVICQVTVRGPSGPVGSSPIVSK